MTLTDFFTPFAHPLNLPLLDRIKLKVNTIFWTFQCSNILFNVDIFSHKNSFHIIIVIVLPWANIGDWLVLYIINIYQPSFNWIVVHHQNLLFVELPHSKVQPKWAFRWNANRSDKRSPFILWKINFMHQEFISVVIFELL